MNISIIGSGNIAWHLVSVFEENDIRVAEVYSRKKKNAEAISGYLYDVNIKTNLNFKNSPSDVFILAVSDDAIQKVASEIQLPSGVILVHTSGAQALNVLLPALENNFDLKLGVFYPLMTFTKGIKVDFDSIPFCIEGENKETENILLALAKSISKRVELVNSHQRSILHVGAVFSCNFTNHLLALAKEILEEEAIDFELLKPLINETFKKAMRSSHPSEVQTGPAVRDDLVTISKHKGILADDTDLLNVYKTLTKSIQDWHQ
jgi:predicted short-subunit dehydrogenase-like oxidoreductase (DUF2520 family)